MSRSKFAAGGCSRRDILPGAPGRYFFYLPVYIVTSTAFGFFGSALGTVILSTPAS
jgi:hypothetical protein